MDTLRIHYGYTTDTLRIHYDTLHGAAIIGTFGTWEVGYSTWPLYRCAPRRAHGRLDDPRAEGSRGKIRRKATNVPCSASAAHRRGPNLSQTDQVGNHAPKPPTPIWNRKTMDDGPSASSFGRPLAPLFNLAPDDSAREARSWACRGLEVRTDLDLDKGYVLGTRIRIGTTWKWECHPPVRLLPSTNPCPRTSDVRRKPGAFCVFAGTHIVDGLPKKLSREAPSPSSPSYRNGGIYPAPDTLLFSTAYGAATTTIIRTTTNTIPSIVTTCVLQRLPHHPLAANAVSDAAISIQHALSVDNTRARVGVTDPDPGEPPCPAAAPLGNQSSIQP
ncbi:hypothetical protein CSOJ01_07834 [Colletotrichum sojae]|uniref:Uncharacterized protein n=1 Tax=Colletotrichum sojae TaxID=2175907 RepID=A0A8H6J7K2_9PEZI|nr:hypothetical protein CSOJ01_07834 [Colletotrichum sojae]